MLQLLLAVVSLLCGSNAWALTENPALSHWDTLFYTFMLSGVLFSAAIVVAYRAYYWLVYVLFSFLLTVNVAGTDGSLAYFIGESDFVTWVVPYLLTASVAAYGYWMIAIRLDKKHALGRFANYFFALAVVSALFPLSCYFWLGEISLVTMWVPVNILFFGMILGQVLPPLTWASEDRHLAWVIRLFPWVVGLFAVGTYLVHFVSAGLSQPELNLLNRLALILDDHCDLASLCQCESKRAG
ncbi:two-component system sensor protein [gamma proteobacterium IMCC2047]|nr:two-component system sensor protein [gamma proteobacterium IMCC2047]